MTDRPSPASVVADADVLAADLLCGGPADADPVAALDTDDGPAARAALDVLREHSWTTLVATAPLLDDAAAVIADLAAPDLAADWRARAASFATVVEQEPGDHPGLAAVHRGGAAHLLTYDEGLGSAGAGLNLPVSVSVRHPRAFCRVFDPAGLWAAVHDGDPADYPGPDRDPRD